MTTDNKFTAVYIIQTALGFKLKGSPEGFLNPIIDKVPIRYSFLADPFLDKLQDEGIPVRTNQPFAAHWLNIILDIKKVNPHVPMWITTLLYAEWGFMYWMTQTLGLNLFKKLHDQQELHTLLKKTFPQAKKGRATSLNSLVTKWWLDDLVLKLRALWDKLPYAIAETSQPKVELKGIRHNARIGELLGNKNQLAIPIEWETIFSKLIEEMKNIEYVKKYRDAELHHHVKPYAEVFGLDERHDSLYAVAQALDYELNRCREALLATIGLILFRNKG